MPIERSTRRVSSRRLGALARALLEASTLCAIATVSPRERSHVHTAYFAWTDRFDIVWLSDPQAGHSRNLRANPSAAVAVHDSHQVWGEADRGIQLFGTARELQGSDAREAADGYASRFPSFLEADLGGYRFYRLRPRRMKVFDERELGSGAFAVVSVRSGGRLGWERTEIYRPGAR